MGQFDIAGTTKGTDQQEAFEIKAESTEGPSDQKETFYTNQLFTTNFGVYIDDATVRAVIDAKSTWTIGKGYTANEETTLLLDTIKGMGVDTFNTLLENCIKTYLIGGDAFMEIIRDDEDVLINLRPLDPATIRIVANRKGVIIRYEQFSKVKKPDTVFQPENIFHLAHNRIADEIHGRSVLDPLRPLILKKREARDDWQDVLHRNVDPVWIFHLDTDDKSKIADFKTKMDSLKGKKGSKNMYIPKDAVVPELINVATNSILSPLAWIESIDAEIYEAFRVPKIIVGGSGGFTEAAVKIAYLAFEQNIEEEQLYVEEQVLSQLNLVINLEFPASLQNELLSDKAKDNEQGGAQPNDTTAGVGA